MSDELPEGWVDAPLSTLAANHDGRRVPVKASDRLARQGAFSYYGASGVIDTIDGYLFDGPFLLVAEDGANLLSRSTPIAFRADGKFWVNNHAHVVEPHRGIDSRYLEYFLNSFDLQHVVTGTAQPKLTQAALSAITVPVAPEHEQRRIVAKVEELLAEVNRAKARLTKVQTILKRFRQSVLAAACSGELTREWRTRNEGTMCDPVLAATIAGLPISPESSTPWPELPDSWLWVPIEKLLRDESALSYGILKPGDFVRAGVPMVRVMDIDDDGGILRDQVLHVAPQVAAPFVRTKLQPGDVLITVMATVGRAAVVPDDLRGWNVNRAVAVLRLNRAFVRPDYMSLVLRSPYFREVFDAGKLGTAQARINIGDLRGFTVPIPPPNEQQAILAAYASIRENLGETERRVASATRRADNLPQAILLRAFSGDLVPTEAELARLEGRDYEPASLLLERVKGETAARMARKTEVRSKKRKRIAEAP